jgi:hypothetical protein
MTAVDVSLVVIAVWLALNMLCLAIGLLRMLLKRSSRNKLREMRDR